MYAVSPGAPYVLTAVFWLLAGVLNGTLRIARRPRSVEAPSLGTLFAGVRFVRNNPAVLGTISLDLFAVLLGGATALLPIFASDILHTGPWGLGLLRAAPAIGALRDDGLAGAPSDHAARRHPHVPVGHPVRRRHHRLRAVAQVWLSVARARW